jgi:hypothetical protein
MCIQRMAGAMSAVGAATGTAHHAETSNAPARR